MHLQAEFTSEPYEGEQEPPEHAREALAVVRATGLSCEFGPLGTVVSGEAEDVLAALGRVLSTVFAHGGTRLTIQVERSTDGIGIGAVGPDR